MATTWELGSEDYNNALKKEGEYWGQEILKATEVGIPFAADMRRAERIFVNRGKGLPQQQTYDPVAERLMNGAHYQSIFDKVGSISERARVLVLTCGPGNLCLELARQGHDVVGMDISEAAIDLARKFAEENCFRDNFGSLEYRVTDLNTVNLEPKHYDAVVAWDGIHHIWLFERLMQQVSQSLTADGLFIFSERVATHWKSRLLGGILYFFLPTYVIYFTKFKYAFGGAKKIHEEMTARSPFEEVTSESILPITQRYFEIIEKRTHTGIGYRAAIAGDMRCPDRLKYPILTWLKKFDDWSVKHGVFAGDHVFVVAKTK